MSNEVNRVIGRAFADEEFRGDLLANPSAALAGFDLTAQEQENLVAGIGKSKTTLSLAGIEKSLNNMLFTW